MNKYLLKSLFIAALAAGTGALTSCSDDVDEGAYYTFTGDTVCSYVESDPQFSIFADMMHKTGTNALLSTYGHYTLFLPNDAAFEEYFRQNGLSLETMSADQMREIVYNHVINSPGRDYMSENFEEGALAEPSMSDNFFVISYKSNPEMSGLEIYVNKTVLITERDIEVHNGVVHLVNSVISPNKDYVSDILTQPEVIGDSQTFNLFAEALRVTHLSDSLERTYDLNYVCPTSNAHITQAGWDCILPKTKRYGYTLFVEPDEVYAAHGIHSIADMEQVARQYYDNGSDDYTDRSNALNQFVAYHILDRSMSTNMFLYPGRNTVPNSMKDRVEFYETMREFYLLKINVGPKLNLQRSGKCVEVVEGLSNLGGANGYVHSINDLLVYDRDVMENDVLNCRIRTDMYNIPPELTNNNIRWHCTESPADGASARTIPHDFCLKHLSFTPETEIVMWASEGWTMYQADELKLNGWYDFTLRLPPVPPGNWEVRMGYSRVWWRGIAQFFLDGEIQGIPRDLRIEGNDPRVGWVKDTGGPEDKEIDKAMRNRGYMKGPASAINYYYNSVLRNDQAYLRVIIGNLNVQEYGAHYLRAKNVLSPGNEYNGDLIELVPVSLIEYEDIY